MAEPKDVNAVVDELSKPGNEAELAKTLNNEFNEISGGDEPGGDKPKTDGAPSDNQPAPAKTGDGEHSNDGGNNDGADNGDNKKPDRFKDLLADRNEARDLAAGKQTDNQILTKQVKDLTDLVQKLVANGGKAQEDGGNDGQPAADDDKPMTKKEALAFLEETLNKRKQADSQAEVAEKSITEAITALETNPATPEAKEYAAEIKALMVKHPTISAYAAYRMLQGEGVIPIEGAGGSNANKTGTGKRSKGGLIKNKKAEDMTQAEAEAHLRNEQAAGTLGV